MIPYICLSLRHDHLQGSHCSLSHRPRLECLSQGHLHMMHPEGTFKNKSVCVRTCSVTSIMSTHCNPTEHSLPGSSVHEILQGEYWSRLPCPHPGIFLTQGSKQNLLCLLHWQEGSLPSVPPKLLVSKAPSRHTITPPAPHYPPHVHLLNHCSSQKMKCGETLLSQHR